MTNLVKACKDTKEFYTISIQPRKRDTRSCHHVVLMKQRPGQKSSIIFRCILKLHGSELVVLSNSELFKPDEIWNESNWIGIAKSLYTFFTKTSNNVSRKWTDGWFLSIKGGKLNYKMYDCSVDFITTI